MMRCGSSSVRAQLPRAHQRTRGSRLQAHCRSAPAAYKHNISCVWDDTEFPPELKASMWNMFTRRW